MRLASLSLIGILVLALFANCNAVAHFGHPRAARPLLQNNSNTTSSNNKNGKKEVICVDGVCHVRGGSSYDDDEYDEEEEELLPPPRKKKRPRSSSSSRAPPPQSRRQPPPRRGPPGNRRGPPPGRRGPPPYRGRRSRQPSLLNSAAGLAKKTAGLTTSAAVGTLKGSGKAAFYLVSPKHVNRREVWGVWRLDQQVNTDTDTPISCAANVEFTPRGEVVVKYKDEAYETTYLFRERSWPQSCTIEFEARAFQGPHDSEPVIMRYKGYFRRKMADSTVVKIVGNIYEVPRKGLWRKGRNGRKVGTFVARRRLSKRETKREFQEDEYEDEYDLEDDEYDESGYEEEDEYEVD